MKYGKLAVNEFGHLAEVNAMGWIVAVLYLGSAIGFYGFLIHRAPVVENDEFERTHPSQLAAEILHIYAETDAEERRAA